MRQKRHGEGRGKKGELSPALGEYCSVHVSAVSDLDLVVAVLPFLGGGALGPVGNSICGGIHKAAYALGT